MSCKIVVLISGGGSNLQALIDSADVPKITAVISNKQDAYGLERAKQAGIATCVIEHTNFKSRDEFDKKLATKIDVYQPDLVVLAGFMRILTPTFAEHYAGKLLNIHPSLLPKYKGLHTHKRVLENKDTEHGASVHFVTSELDGGPIIAQGKLDVLANDTPETLAQRVLQIEHKIYPQVVSWFACGRLQLVQNKVKLDGKFTAPYII